MKRFAKLTALIASGILCLTLSACGETNEKIDFFAMDTYMTVSVYGRRSSGALREAKNAVYAIEEGLSATKAGSELSRLNETGEQEVSTGTAELLKTALAVQEETDGAFDICVSPAVAAWGFYDDAYRVPDAAELAALAEQIRSSEVQVDGSHVTLSEGTRLDLGAIAKGYASREISRILAENGVRSALIFLGGSVQVTGAKPDGRSWRVAVRHPDEGEETLGIWSGCDCSLVTSGDYERFFEQDGVRYHHILDAATAAPARSGLRSVTVVCPDPVRADALSTALFVMGEERALDFWRDNGGFELILFTEDGRLLLTEGVSGSFETDFAAEVVTR